MGIQNEGGTSQFRSDRGLSRRCFLGWIARIGATAELTTLPFTHAEGQRPSTVVPADLDAEIRKHRTGEFNLKLMLRNGSPVANAEVELSQKSHQFLFGCNIFRWGRLRSPTLEERYRELFVGIFNYATLPFYWRSYEPQPGKSLHDYIELVARWCQEHNIRCKGHPLIWDHEASSPDQWLPDELAEIKRLSLSRVKEIVDQFKGLIDIWDVVNEPTDLTRFSTKMNRLARQLGSVQYCKLFLTAARESNPKATLLINDYRTDKAYFDIVSKCQDEQGNWLIDAIGIQSHMHGGVWPSERIWEVCSRFAQLGLPLHFTETTIVSGRRTADGRWSSSTPEGEEEQAIATEHFYKTLFAHPAVQAITWWDFSDNGAWMGAPAGWLRSDMTPKPVYHRMRELIRNRWWTNAKGTTDQHGIWKCQAFFGDYTLRVRTSGGAFEKEIKLHRETPRQLTIELA